MKWTTEGRSEPVRSFFYKPDSHVVTLQQYRTLAKAIRKRQRSDKDPLTLDFDYEDVPGVYDKAQSLIEEANEMFKFHIDGWQQPLRFNAYPSGTLFGWHSDYCMNDNSKLAFTHIIQSADEGGDLQLMIDGGIRQIPLKAGDTIVFPAFVAHHVTEIIQGERIALVGWATGRQFV